MRRNFTAIIFNDMTPHNRSDHSYELVTTGYKQNENMVKNKEPWCHSAIQYHVTGTSTRDQASSNESKESHKKALQ